MHSEMLSSAFIRITQCFMEQDNFLTLGFVWWSRLPWGTTAGVSQAPFSTFLDLSLHQKRWDKGSIQKEFGGILTLLLQNYSSPQFRLRLLLGAVTETQSAAPVPWSKLSKQEKMSGHLKGQVNSCFKVTFPEPGATQLHQIRPLAKLVTWCTAGCKAFVDVSIAQ